MKTIKLFAYLGVAVLAICLLGCSNVKTEDVAVSKDGVNIRFEKKGWKKPAIIFIHGWSNPRTIWEDQVEHFSKNYTAVALDLAGSGDSGHDRKNWTINAFSDDVVAVMDKLSLDDVVLVGFSMGAMVAVETANRVPNRVLGVVNVDELKNPGMQIPEEMMNTMVDNYMGLVTTGFTNENLVAGGFYKKNEEVAFKKLSEMYDNVSHIGWKESLENALKWMNESQKASLKELKVPYVGIFSDNEPVEIDSIKALVPTFKADIIANTGHLVFWDDPEKFNELLEKDIKEFVE